MTRQGVTTYTSCGMPKPSRLLDLASRLAPALGAGLALAILALFARIPDAEAGYLAKPALGVLAAVGWLAPRRNGEAALGALWVVVAAWVLPPGPVRGAAVMLILAATLAATVTRRVAATGRWTPTAWLALAFGLQFLLRSPRMFDPDWGLRLAGTFFGLPLVAAVSLLWVERRWGNRAALGLGLLTVLPDVGFSVRSTLVLVLLAGLASIPRRRLVPVPGAVLALAGASAFLVGLTGSYPWLRPEPWTSVTAGTVELIRSPAAPVAADPGMPVVLSQHVPAFALDGFDAPISRVVLDTHLTDSATLPAGTPVATVRLKTEGGRTQRTWTLAAGVDTGEWAASRPDVAAVPGFRAPAPWVSWIPPEGSFFAHRYRSRFALDEPLEAAVLSVVRRSDLPPGVGLVVTSAEVR